MEWLNIIFGAIGVISFVFSIYTYYKAESKKIVESAKIAMQKERFENTYYALLSLLHSVDAIVQTSKQANTTVEQLQNMARLTRGQIYILSKQLELEQKRLKDWRFGKLIESDTHILVNHKESPDDSESN